MSEVYRTMMTATEIQLSETRDVRFFCLARLISSQLRGRVPTDWPPMLQMRTVEF